MKKKKRKIPIFSKCKFYSDNIFNSLFFSPSIKENSCVFRNIFKGEFSLTSDTKWRRYFRLPHSSTK